MIVYPASHRPMASKSSANSSRAPLTRKRTTSHPFDIDKTEDAPPAPVRKASTFSSDILLQAPTSPEDAGPDAFETNHDSESDEADEPTRASVELDELPIELITLTDSFVSSLTAKVHSAPPSIEKLSQLFRDFYVSASSNIATHVSMLASKHSREASPAPSVSSISSAASRLRSKATSPLASSQPAGQQMITSEELAERKKIKKAWENKRALLEEAVERRLCEGIYDRIYRHRSTQDEAQDDKLRSKTAALALVGISPADLGVDLGTENTTDVVTDIKERFASARADFVHMHESRYPLGKLNHLRAAHRSVVDTLAHFHPSASADEIMPMLIYTLITLPPENIHVISDLHFIQSFRWEPKLTGEAAYCLTNLEAVISFLQTVDLTTLRAEEQLSGPPKISSNPQTPKTETFPPAYPQGSSPATVETSKAPPNSSSLKTTTNPLRNRRLSDLVNTPAQAFGAASDAVFNTADQGIKTISNSLGDSYKFLLGKVRERQDGPKDSIAVPRTLDDARKLVSTPPPSELEDGDLASGTSSNLDPEETDSLKQSTGRDDHLLNMIGGRRDRSADSSRSRSSTNLAAQQQQNPAVLEQMRQLGNQFNPMARLSSISSFRGFGRNAPTPGPTKETKPGADGGDLGTAFPDIAAALPPKPIPKIAPPNKRFLELQSPGDLKLGEVIDLLKDYRRLAGALKKMGAFEEK